MGCQFKGETMLAICDMCQKEKNGVSYQPSRSALVFGGFGKTEKRCSACEKIVIKSINKILKNVGK